MNDIQTLLKSLRRPKLLIEAARIGLPQYRRERHLERLLNQSNLPGSRQAAVKLYCLEQEHDEARRAGSAAYSVARHLDVLIALMAEARAVATPATQPHENASATSAFLRAI